MAALDTKYGLPVSSNFYYAIDNEWDLYNDGANPPNKLYSAAQIAANIKAFAIEMKGQNPNIKIVGPSLSSFWATDKYNANIMNDLIGSGSSNDITVAIPFNSTYPLINGKYYIDVVDIHSYAQGNNGNMSSLNSQTTFNTWRANAVGFPYASPGFLDVLSTASYGLIGKLNTANSSRATGSKLTFAVTELNITYSNTALPITSQSDPLQNTAVSIQARSFFAGQYWLNMYSTILNNGSNMADFVTPWSIHESGGGGSSKDLGMTKGLANATTPPTPLSTYYHNQMLAWFCDSRFQYVQNYYYPATTDNSNVKAFAVMQHGRGSNSAVFIMNQNESGNLSDTYTVRFDNTLGSSTYNINVPLTPPITTSPGYFQYTGTIGPETTIMLEFACDGTLMNKYEYRETDAIADNAPGVIQYGGSPCRGGAGDIGDPKPVCPVKTIGHTVYNTNTTLTESLTITGVLKIPNNKELIINGAYLSFEENAKIEVMPGGKLTILRSTLTSCKGVKWKGIDVNGNFLPNTIVTIRDSKISNAITALTADKLKGIVIERTQFDNGTTALNISRSSALEISNNEFYRYDYGIKTSSTVIDLKRSFISLNTFAFINTVISFNSDNHSKMDISCNRFGKYRDYAIKSTNTILKDQGTTSEGTGNIFDATTSTYPQNKLNHTGNMVKYYFDPSHPVFNGEMTAVVNPSTQDSRCNVTTSNLNARAGNPDTRTSNKDFAENLYTSAFGEIKYKLYPNPNNGNMTLDYTLNMSDKGLFIIYDLTGRKISEHVLSPNSNTRSISDQDIMETGMYMYILYVNGKTVATDKIIISK